MFLKLLNSAYLQLFIKDASIIDLSLLNFKSNFISFKIIINIRYVHSILFIFIMRAELNNSSKIGTKTSISYKNCPKKAY